jgi:hypothetical protein
MTTLNRNPDSNEVTIKFFDKEDFVEFGNIFKEMFFTTSPFRFIDVKLVDKNEDR